MSGKKYEYEDIFTPPTYEVGEEYLGYADKIKEAEDSIKSVDDYKGTYSEQIDKAVSDYLGTDQFSFNPNNSSTYQQIRNQYLSDGKKAMEDTLASGALLSGGHNNSAALVAGQQVYNDYLKGVTDAIPTLEAQEYERYQNELNKKLADIELLSGLDDAEYSRYLDVINQEYQNLSHLKDMQNSAASLDANKNSFNQGNWSTLSSLVQNEEFHNDDMELNVQTRQDNLLNTRLDTLLGFAQSGVSVTVPEDITENFGITQEMFDDLVTKVNTQTVSYSSSSDSGNDDDTEVQKADTEALISVETELQERLSEEGATAESVYEWAEKWGADKYGLSDEQFNNAMTYFFEDYITLEGVEDIVSSVTYPQQDPLYNLKLLEEYLK